MTWRLFLLVWHYMKYVLPLFRALVCISKNSSTIQLSHNSASSTVSVLLVALVT